MTGAWESLTPWLGGLLSDRALHIRANLGMLASDLSQTDPEAERAFAEMLARACDAVVRNDDPDDLKLLDILTRERKRASQAKRAALDAICMAELERLSQNWDPERAVDRLMRAERGEAFIPVSVLASATLESARYLARPDEGGKRGDDARRRLKQAARLDREAPSSFRNELRLLLRKQLAKLSPRESRLTQFVLMQRAPSLLRAGPGGVVIAGASELDSAARAGRPSKGRLFLFAIASAAALSAALTAFEFFVIALTSDPTWDMFGAAVVSFVSLFVIALAPSFGVGVYYTPSVGRGRPPWRRMLRRVARPSVVGCAVLMVTLFFIGSIISDNNANMFGWKLDHPYDLFAVLAGVTVLTFGATAALTPHAVFLVRDRTAKSGVRLAGATLAAAIIALATLGCGAAILLGDAPISWFWAPMAAACGAVATTLTAIEIETLPSGGRLGGARAKVVPIYAVIGGLCALIAAPAVVKVCLDWLHPPIEKIIAGDGASPSAFVEPASKIEFAFKAKKTSAYAPNLPQPHRLVNGAGAPFRLVWSDNVGQGTICVDHCPGSVYWYQLDHWLQALFSHSVPITLTEVSSTEVDRTDSLDISGSTPVPEALDAGVIYAFEVPAGSQIALSRFSLAGDGDFGDSPLLAVYSAEDGKPFLKKERYMALSPGKYTACVYFSEHEVNACNPNNKQRYMFEKGAAKLTLYPPPQ